MRTLPFVLVLSVGLFSGCHDDDDGTGTGGSGGTSMDGGMDGGMMDAGMMDAGMMDAGMMDAGMMDAGMMDAGMMDAGMDASDLCDGVTCDDMNECTADTCDSMDGLCDFTQVATGTSCDSGDGACDASGMCVANDLCDGVTCDDSNECTLDACTPTDGMCVFTPDDGASCMSGAGVCDAAGMCLVTPDPITKIIDAACSNSFNSVNFPLPVSITVTPDGPILGGAAFDADISVSIELTEDFIAGMFGVGPLTVTIDSAQVTVGARSGATGADVVSVLPGTPFTQNIFDDPDMNGIPGPLNFQLSTVTGTFTASASGDVVFDIIGSPEAAPPPGDSGISISISILGLGPIVVEVPCGSGVFADDGMGGLALPVTPHPDADVIVFAID